MPQKINLSLILALIFLSNISFITQEGIHVSVINLRNNKGHVLISLFRECEGYPDVLEKAFRKTRAIINNQTASFGFSDLPAGNYSIAIMHDENDDEKMNTNFLGIPKEGYGFSNNVMGAFGPPTCSRASFRHLFKTQITIRTRYGW